MAASLAVVISFAALVWCGFLVLVTPREQVPLPIRRAFLLYLLLVAVLYGALAWASYPLASIVAGGVILASGVILSLLVLAFPGLLRSVGLWVERTVLPSQYRTRRMIEEVTEAAPAVLELEPLVAMILERTVQTLDIRWGLFALWDRATLELHAVATRGLPEAAADAHWPKDHSLTRWLLEASYDAREEVLLHSQPPGNLASLDPAWIVPVRLREEPVGLFLYGPHNEGRPYTVTERSILDLLANETSAAVANARLFNMVARARREWLQTFDALSDGVFLHDREGRIRRANRAFSQLVGRPFSEIISQPWYELIPAGPEPRQACSASRSAEREPRIAEYDLAFGGSRTLHITVSPLGEGAESCVHVVREVTAERAMQLQLAQAEKLAAIGQMLSGVAHELNNPLTTIIGFSELLQSADVPQQVKADLERICRQAKRSSRIVQSLLTFARQSRIQVTEVDVNTLLTQTLDFMQPQFESRHIQVQLDLDAQLPHTLADAGQLQQVFLNLFTNAVQAMSSAHHGGTLRLVSRATSTVVQVAVCDDGPGIPAGLLNRIFDPFFSTKPVGEGTGLGLSICYGIVREHGGRIWAESQEGQGASFFIELPIRHASVSPEPPPARPTLGERRILVVEDEEPIVALLRRVLEPAGSEILTARDGEQGLQVLREAVANRTVPDLIIADLKMPRLDGCGFFQHVRDEYPELAGRFLFITGDAVRPETQSFLQEGDLPYLCKPFSVREIEAAVSKALAARQSQ